VGSRLTLRQCHQRPIGETLSVGRDADIEHVREADHELAIGKRIFDLLNDRAGERGIKERARLLGAHTGIGRPGSPTIEIEHAGAPVVRPERIGQRGSELHTQRNLVGRGLLQR
jgi:hypothetical protein